MIDINGKEIQFSDVLSANKGKKIVIDIWASWCGDCKVGMNSLKILQGNSDNNEVVYVLLSIDKDENKWKSAIKQYGLSGQHFRIPLGWKNPLSNYIQLDWIPRYFVVNEHGKIILPKAITAKDEKMTKVILD
jgi:thiol-disulfide isomerase/thioredoxin